MKDYVNAFQKKIAEIDYDAQRVNIINAGVMNHGKSSLFNSLLDANIFAEEDIRTTTENRAERWSDDVYLIDTPGLSAEVIDDAVAGEAYRRANVILFVHKTNTGELHKNGIDWLNKIKSLFSDEKFFIKHFCLVLTSIDDQSVRDRLDTIRDKTLADIKNHCGLSGFKVFLVSNTRYRKGMAEHKNLLVEQSGIPELRSYLQKNFSTWRNENKIVRAARIAREKKDFVSQLQQERKKIQARIQAKQEQIQQRQENFLREIETVVSQRRDDESRYNSEKSRLENMRQNLQNLREQWERERY